MEARLLPVNAVLGLLTPGDVNPAALADQGFRLVGLEVPIVSPDGRVVVDLVLFNAKRRHLVLLEAKSGANVEPNQAQRYATLDPLAVIQATGVSLPARGEVTVEVAYVCLEANALRIRQGLGDSGLQCALIRVAARAITLDRPSDARTPLDAAWESGPILLSGPIVRLLPYDQDSDAPMFEAAVRAQLVAELSHRRSEVTIRLLTEQIVPYFAIFSGSAQTRLVAKVREVVRSIVEDAPETYGYLPATATRREDGVELRKTPENRDPRGRTQAYQAIYGQRGARRDQGERRQMDLLDLLAETTGEDANGGEQGEDTGEEEVE